MLQKSDLEERGCPPSSNYQKQKTLSSNQIVEKGSNLQSQHFSGSNEHLLAAKPAQRKKVSTGNTSATISETASTAFTNSINSYLQLLQVDNQVPRQAEEASPHHQKRNESLWW